MKEKYHSVHHEPAHASSPAGSDGEARSAPKQSDEIDALRDSVSAEPFADPDQTQRRFCDWLARRRTESSLAGNLLTTLLAALLSGPAAVLGAFMTVGPTWFLVVYMVVVGPIIEELFKQSGMTFVLERMPYRIFSVWQFIFGGVVGGLTFAAIENLVYLNVYAAGSVEDPAALSAYRWTVCVALHVGCSTLASLGLVRVWFRMHRLGRPPQLADAGPFFIAAVVIHGAYNLWAWLLGPQF